MAQLQGLLSNPALQMGLGILANNNTDNFGQVIGRGGLLGMQNIQQARRQEMVNKIQVAQLEEHERRKKQQNTQSNVFRNIAEENNIDPNTLTAFPSIGKEYVKSQLLPKQVKFGFTPDGRVYDQNNPNSLQLGESYAKPQPKPTPVQEYEYAVGQGFKGNIFDYQKQKAAAGASRTSVTYGAPVSGVDAGGNPVFFQPSKDGSAPSIVEGFTPPPKSATESQAKAATFYSQMVNANKTLEGIEGYDPESLSDQVGTAYASGVGNLVVSPANQQARQAQNQWAEAFLRIKTGAAATKQEVENNVQTFFPQAGDSPEVVLQKANARVQAENDVLQMTQDPNQILMKGAEMPKSQAMSELPPANKHKGRVILDQETGKKLRSNGMQWKEVK